MNAAHDNEHSAETVHSSATLAQFLQNRDIGNLFAGLELFASVLLKSGVREVLFRKPGRG